MPRYGTDHRPIANTVGTHKRSHKNTWTRSDLRRHRLRPQLLRIRAGTVNTEIREEGSDQPPVRQFMTLLTSKRNQAGNKVLSHAEDEDENEAEAEAEAARR